MSGKLPAAATYTLLNGEAYLQAMLRDIPKATRRIVVAAMIVLAGPKTDHVFELLKAAAARGVRVTILWDVYMRLPLYGVQPSASKAPRLKRTLKTFEELHDLGARIYAYGKIGIVPYKGRCHIKCTVIDDTAYAFGGINFYDEAFANADYALRTTAPGFADCLAQLVARIGRGKSPLADGEEQLATDSSVLFDGGRPGHSIVYERACELTAQAKRVFYVSQMTPSGELGRLLHDTDSTCYFNHPRQMLAPDRWGQAFDQHRWRVENAYRGTGFIHAKFILFELHSGRKALLTGSNNFSYRGIAYGTQELGLYSTNASLWRTLQQYLKQRIQAA